MTLNGRYALCSKKDASFGANCKNLNEDRPILSATKMYRPMTLVALLQHVATRLFSRLFMQYTVPWHRLQLWFSCGSVAFQSQNVIEHKRHHICWDEMTTALGDS